MKKYFVFAIGVATILFLIPFFWHQPGFVDLGGDSGRLYFIEPLVSALTLFGHQDLIGVSNYSNIPYQLYLSSLLFLLKSPTTLIAFDNGLKLSFSFLFVYLLVRNVLVSLKEDERRATLTGIVSGCLYLSLMSVTAWSLALDTHYQIFLNPLISFLVFQLLLTRRFIYTFLILLSSIVYSVNFGYSAMPQLLSFYPLMVLFLLVFHSQVLQRRIPYKEFFLLSILLIGLHAFHLIPTFVSTLGHGNPINSDVFQNASIRSSAVHYFKVNHEALGKLSTQLFQPTLFYGQSVFTLFVPVIIVAGFVIRRTKALIILGLFFALTFFLVSANITNIGVYLYSELFRLPGFMMFRSFNDKWYVIYAFFYTLLFACSFSMVTKKMRTNIVIILAVLLSGISLYRSVPLLRADFLKSTHYQSKNVSSVFTVDPDLLEATRFVRTLPAEGKMLTLPLTFPTYQIAYGKEGGAYVGVPLVNSLTGKGNIAGFWMFGSYAQYIFDALREENIQTILQLLSFQNIRYIYHNSDIRITDNFPDFPYVYPGLMYSSKDQIPFIIDQAAYKKFLSLLPTTKIYEKGFYSIYEIDDSYIRPSIYIPTEMYAQKDEAIQGSHRSAFFDELVCQEVGCRGFENKSVPEISFKKISQTKYEITVTLPVGVSVLPIVLLEPYSPYWNLSFEKINDAEIQKHVLVNGYANAWIIDTRNIPPGKLYGTIELSFQKYYYWGRIITVLTMIVIILTAVWSIFFKRYENK